MSLAAARLLRTVEREQSRTWCYVGWNGECITAGAKVKTAYPHVRIDVELGEDQEVLEAKLAGAVASVRLSISLALKKKRVVKMQSRENHSWNKAGHIGQGKLPSAKRGTKRGA